MQRSISDIRTDYKLRSLNESDVSADPIAQFTNWWDEAVNSKIDEVNAMTLATVNNEGRPSARIVLLKGFDEKGFVFFTNYQSKKGKELEDNPHGALVFFWKELERQVRIEGGIEKISEEDNDAYYQSRPAGSRIGAWASPQSEVIEGREILENNFKALEKKFESGSIPRPGHWGGYILRPSMIEFWQGRSSRLHDRIQYSLKEKGWVIERLAP
ncbi:MAG: pyridoxamine 5'-phosphate oxidase [Bacteroidota bacterium]